MPKEWTDPIQTLHAQGQKIPEYQQMMEYLMVRRQVPEMRTPLNPYSGTQGLFQFGGDLQSRGRISIRADQDVNSLVHEITHATERQMMKQYVDEKYGTNPITGFRTQVNKTQFTDAYEKLNAQTLMRLVNPNWKEQAKEYRSTTPEARAFAMENAISPTVPDPITRGPAHVDSTLATEFLILLDLATRAEKAKPQSQGR